VIADCHKADENFALLLLSKRHKKASLGKLGRPSGSIVMIAAFIFAGMNAGR